MQNTKYKKRKIIQKKRHQRVKTRKQCIVSIKLTTETDIRSQVTIITKDIVNNLAPYNYKKGTMKTYSKLLITHINLDILTKIKIEISINKNFNSIKLVLSKKL